MIVLLIMDIAQLFGFDLLQPDGRPRWSGPRDGGPRFLSAAEARGRSTRAAVVPLAGRAPQITYLFVFYNYFTLSQRMPGSIPFIPRIIFCMPPLATIFIIFCVCSNWFSS